MDTINTTRFEIPARAASLAAPVKVETDDALERRLFERNAAQCKRALKRLDRPEWEVPGAARKALKAETSADVLKLLALRQEADSRRLGATFANEKAERFTLVHIKALLKLVRECEERDAAIIAERKAQAELIQAAADNAAADDEAREKAFQAFENATRGGTGTYRLAPTVRVLFAAFGIPVPKGIADRRVTVTPWGKAVNIRIPMEDHRYSTRDRVRQTVSDAVPTAKATVYQTDVSFYLPKQSFKWKLDMTLAVWEGKFRRRQRAASRPALAHGWDIARKLRQRELALPILDTAEGPSKPEREVLGIIGWTTVYYDDAQDHRLDAYASWEAYDNVN
jgi:hypothetical protein